MVVTTVHGMDTDRDRFYWVELDPARRLVDVPDFLRAQFPHAGATVRHQPSELPVRFDPDAPAAVYVWLTAATNVLEIDGPYLGPAYEVDPDVVY